MLNSLTEQECSMFGTKADQAGDAIETFKCVTRWYQCQSDSVRLAIILLILLL
jgi:hypothetical protein